mmetsp:Transcript_53398/g.129927  ORF Transcript_53398/g.129927 Transcript_53398/m.129927 type:complete len:397 (+) Transcript_53398:160-1350(+)
MMAEYITDVDLEQPLLDEGEDSHDEQQQQQQHDENFDDEHDGDNNTAEGDREVTPLCSMAALSSVGLGFITQMVVFLALDSSMGHPPSIVMTLPISVLISIAVLFVMSIIPTKHFIGIMTSKTFLSGLTLGTCIQMVSLGSTAIMALKFGNGNDDNNDDDDDDVSCTTSNTCSDSSISCNQSTPSCHSEATTTTTTIAAHQKQQQKEMLKSHLKHQKYVVQGYDKDGRSTLYFVPRNVQSHDMEWTMKEAIYSIERAVACSKSKDKTINAVVDFSGFNLSKHSPPVDVGKEFLMTLRSHYAGQIHSIYLVNTPFSFNIIWKIFSPFVGTQTRDKIKFWSNASNKKRNPSSLLDLYDIDQLPNWLVNGGGSNRAFDIDEYLHELSFDEAFDAREQMS